MSLPILPTTVVGSYSMPGWLERLKTEYFARRISRQELDEIHDAAVKAAIKDQEVCGVDVITDGELRRDNMIDYFAERLPGVQTDHTSKKFYYDFYDSVVRGKLPMASLRLADDFRFLAAFTDRTTKFCVTGPHSLVKRIKDEHYKNEEAFAMDLARVMNMELKELARAGARYIQIDEPAATTKRDEIPEFITSMHQSIGDLAGKAFFTVHICFSDYQRLFPAILELQGIVDEFHFEYANRDSRELGVTVQKRPGYAFLPYFKDNAFKVGLGVVDVHTDFIESPELVRDRVLYACEIIGDPERLRISSDCGLRTRTWEVAFQKLSNMVEGCRLAARQLGT